MDERRLPRMEVLRTLTDDAVLDLLLRGTPMTRAELARASRISKPTIAESVRRLAAEGLLAEVGTQGGRQGRVGTLYAVSPDAGFVLALDLSPVALRARICDLAGDAVWTDAADAVQPRTTDAVSRAVRALARRAARHSGGRGPLRALAVSMANSVDPDTGRVVDLLDSPYAEGIIDVRAAVAPTLGAAPLLVDNDVNLAAVAEHEYGAARGTQNCCYVFIGAGLGLGLILGGRVVHGAGGLAGEIGYLAAGSSAVRHELARTVTRAGFGRGDTDDRPLAGAQALLAAADRGERAARTAVDRLARTVGAAVATVCAVVDPGLVVLGGPIGLHPALVEPVRAEAARLAPVAPRVVTGQLGEQASLRGASLVALQRARRDLLASG